VRCRWTISAHESISGEMGIENCVIIMTTIRFSVVYVQTFVSGLSLIIIKFIILNSFFHSFSLFLVISLYESERILVSCLAWCSHLRSVICARKHQQVPVSIRMRRKCYWFPRPTRRPLLSMATIRLERPRFSSVPFWSLFSSRYITLLWCKCNYAKFMKDFKSRASNIILKIFIRLYFIIRIKQKIRNLYEK